MLNFSQELEAICQRGCEYTQQAIRQLNANETPAELQHLSAIQQQEICRELVQIMSVYD